MLPRPRLAAVLVSLSLTACAAESRELAGAGLNRTLGSNETPLRFDAAAPVVAVATDGAFAVRRVSGIEVYRADGVALGLVPTRPGDDRPGTWFGLDKRGATLAVLRDQDLELWQPGASAPRAKAAVGSSSWGPPRFLASGDVVTHHQGELAIWSSSTGAQLLSLHDQLLTLVRASFDGPPGTMLVRCSRNSPSVANTMPFVLGTPKGGVIDRLGPHRDGVTAAVASNGGWLTADDEAIYEFGADNVELARVSLPGVEVLANAPTGVAFGAALGAAGVIDLEQGRVLRFSTGRKERVVFVSATTHELTAVDAQGGRFVWQLKAPSEAIAVTRSDAPIGRARRAIDRIALSDLEGAEKGLAAAVVAQEVLGVKAGADALVFALAGRYTRSLLAHEEAAAFVQKLAGGSLDPKTSQVSEAWLTLAQELTRAEALDAGFDLYFTWLKGVHSGAIARSDDQRAVAVGLAVDALLRSADAEELRQALLRAMSKVFPKDKRIEERLAELADQGG